MRPQTAAADEAALSRASTALWVATLALMTAFLHNTAPAHRYLIARKIARNLRTLREQDCFTTECRMIFSNLAERWHSKADLLSPEEARPTGGIGFLASALLKPR